MRSFWLFRSNLLNFENYHTIKNLETFKLRCHDFYLLQTIWFLENNIFDQVIIWRLSDKTVEDIIFKIDGKKFIQRWVKNFNEVFNYSKPYISFFRGGFPDYDEITKKNPNFFGLKLYLGAGKRLTPQFGGIYDKILIEDERDFVPTSIPFYKTTNPNIFKPLDLLKHYDLCLISNFSQQKYKGTDFIIDQISKSKVLKKLNICHIGNKSDIGIKLCKQKNIKNIEFFGHLERPEINEILNKSKFAIVSSNMLDGCPRIITEILNSGTPLLLRHQTRLLSYYRKFCKEFNDKNFIEKTLDELKNFGNTKRELIKNLYLLSMDLTCKNNLEVWR